MRKSQSLELSNFNDIVELTDMESSVYDGGESLWYWVGYAIGSVERGLEYVWDTHRQMMMQQGGSASSMPFK